MKYKCACITVAAALLTACGGGEIECVRCDGRGEAPEGHELAEGEPSLPDALEEGGAGEDARELPQDAAGEEGAPADAPSEDAGAEEEPPPPPVAYSFAVFGDNQFATESCTSGVQERMAVPKAVLDQSPTLLLHTGDLMDHGYDDGAYAKFTDCYRGLLGRVPFFPTMGNHDAGSGGILNYKAFLEERLFTANGAAYGGTYDEDFTIVYEDDTTAYSTDPGRPSHTDVLPSGFTFKTFYAFRFKNAYFMSFEVGTRWWTNTPKTWVESHLAAARSDPAVRFIFVYQHHPYYSTTMAESADGECILPVRRQYQQYFRDYDVTMVFGGHAHVYDRFLVPDDGAGTRARPSPGAYDDDGGGVHYIVTGGGGGPLPGGCSPPPGEREGEPSYGFSQSRGCGYHFTLVEVEDGEIIVSIIGVRGSADSFTTTAWDTFTITQP